MIPPIPLALAAHDPAAFSDRLAASFRETGFAVVSEHGLDQTLIERAFAATQAFFALPDDAKRRYHVPGGGGQRGYTPFGVEAAKNASLADLKEFWHVGRELPEGHRYAQVMPANLWPSDVADFRSATYGLFQALEALGARVLEAVAAHLGLPQDYFATATRDGNSILRLLHYPPVAPGMTGVRAEAHEDINVITLLLGAEEAGLQLLTRDGRWLDVNPPPGSVVVNVGDMLQRLTNHVLPSTTHRVVNPAPERAHLPRLSMPFFLHFAPDFVIETLPACVSPDRPNRYPTPITAQDFLLERLREIRLV